MPLPRPPLIELEIVTDATPSASAHGGFVNLRRLELVARYPDGETSPPFRYDLAERAAMDAVVIAAYFKQDDETRVWLRSSVRPPCMLRREPPHGFGNQWEVVAGLVEPFEDAVTCAVRELEEELGARMHCSAFVPLGEWTFPAAGLIGERHVFFSVEVHPHMRGTPTEDGSPLERGANIIDVPLTVALDACKRGIIRDAKTELALRRLADVR